MRSGKAAFLAADRLLELIKKMHGAMKSPFPCQVTARAMWTIFLKELANEVRNETQDPGPFKVGQKRFLGMTKDKDLAGSATIGLQFWQGFRDGLEDATMNTPSTRIYVYGYRSGSLRDGLGI